MILKMEKKLKPLKMPLTCSKKNYPVDDIAEITGLSLQKVLELQENITEKV